MNKQLLGICAGDFFKVPLCEALPQIRQIGFDAISPVWNKDAAILKQTVQDARSLGLIVQSIHAPHRGSGDLWNSNPDVSESSLQQLLQSVKDCAEMCVPILVVHTWNGFDFSQGHLPSGLKNFSLLVEAAHRHGVRIAFENLQGEQYLYALMEHFQDAEHVGFCWDSGHQLCYAPHTPFLRDFGNRLFMTHLNSNPGISDPDGSITAQDDVHYLPFDGAICWDTLMSQLCAARPQEILSFEVKQISKDYQPQNQAYLQQSFEEYLTNAYQQARILANRYITGRNTL